MRPTVSDRVQRRGSLLVGRADELEHARRLIAEEGEDVVLHVHGPGGVGKTAYLREVERLARDGGRPTVWVDTDELDPTRGGVLEALGVSGPEMLSERLPAGTVVLLDRFERLTGLERWFWREVVMALPADARLVVAGRRPPSALDDRLHDLVTLLPLRNLPPADAAHLLHARGIPEDVDVADLVEQTYGHPLAVVIAADGWVGRGSGGAVASATLSSHPDPGAWLLGRFVDDVDDPLRRAALHVAAHVRRVDRVLLRDALGVDVVQADDLLTWLRERPYAEVHHDGLGLHDVVRDALEEDLRWRDPDGYGAMHRAVREIHVRRLRRGDEAMRVRAATDALYLHRGNPLTRGLYDYEAMGSNGTRPATRDDRAAVVEAFTRVEGQESGGAVGRLVEDAPGTVHVLEDGTGGLLGALAQCGLDDPATRPATRVAARSWEMVSARRPPQPGEHVLLQTAVGADHPRGLRVVTDLVAARSLLAWSRPDLGWVVLSSRHPDAWSAIWTYIGFEELGAVPLEDGTTASVWARDFGRSPFETWLEQLRPHELDTTGTPPRPVAAPVAWTREEFVGHVRDLLRDLHRPDRLAANPLVRSELVRHGSDVEPGEQLRDAVVDAVAAVEEDPVSRRAARAVDRTYLRRGLTQEAAAQVLGMPFSTYRRHLARGVEEVTDRLWSWEVHGGRQVSST